MEFDIARARGHGIAATLRRSARRYSGDTAIVCGAVEWSYAELDRIVDQVGAGLAALGLKLGDRIAILARNSHAFVALRYGAARFGTAVVPINFMLQPAEVRFILEHSGAQALFVDSASGATGIEASHGLIPANRTVAMPDENGAGGASGLIAWDAFLREALPGAMSDAPSEIVQIMYTSGTESRPKGVLMTHGSLLCEYASCLHALDIVKQDRFLHAMPLFHCAQLDVFLGPCLAVGATNIITARSKAESVRDLIKAQQVTSFFAPPTLWIDLMRQPAIEDSLRSLSKAYYGASIMPVEVIATLRRILPGLRFWNCYGQTEIAPLASVLDPQGHDSRLGSVGRSVLHVETRIVDDDGGDVATGQIGEIVHRSPQLMSGYLNDPEKTADAFRDGWFHSGDLGRFDDDGYLTIVDRKKDMIKSGGENVASSEVENVILALDSIREVAVIGLPDPRWIERVVAVVVINPERLCTDMDIIAHCRGSLASYKVPKSIVIVDELTKNASGKIMKREIRNQIIQQMILNGE